MANARVIKSRISDTHADRAVVLEQICGPAYDKYVATHEMESAAAGTHGPYFVFAHGAGVSDLLFILPSHHNALVEGLPEEQEARIWNMTEPTAEWLYQILNKQENVSCYFIVCS